VGAHERTFRDSGGGKRLGVYEIGCGELRREPHERTREGGCRPDTGKDRAKQQSGGAGADRVGMDKYRGSNDVKTSAE